MSIPLMDAVGSPDGSGIAHTVQVFVGGTTDPSAGGPKGYVWDVADALLLRRSCRVQGSFVGGVSQFKNQNAINGLPMELSADEVTFLLRSGRAQLRARALHAGALEPPRQHACTEGERSAHAGGGHAGGERPAAHAGPEEAYASTQQQLAPLSKRQRGGDGAYFRYRYHEEDYYAYYEGVGAYDGEGEGQGEGAGWDEAAIDAAAYAPGRHIAERVKAAWRQQRQQGSQGAGGSRPEQQGGQRDGGGGGNNGEGRQQQHPQTCAGPPGLYADDAGKEAAWKLPLLEGGYFELPLTASAAAALPGAGARLAGQQGQQQQQQQHGQQQAAEAGAATAAAATAATTETAAAAGPGAGTSGNAQGQSAEAAVHWPYPATPQDWVRFLVYCDLHAKGYTLSCGAKFGADLLAYPGDPSEYHAQFTVRPVLPSASLNPILLKSAARGSHTARKHLMFGTVHGLDAWLEARKSSSTGAAGSAGSAGAASAAGTQAAADLGAAASAGVAEGVQEAGGQEGGGGQQQAGRVAGAATGAAPGVLDGGNGFAWLRSVALPPVTYVSIAPEAGFGGK